MLELRSLAYMSFNIKVQKLISIIIAHTYIVIKLLACSLNKLSK